MIAEAHEPTLFDPVARTSDPLSSYQAGERAHKTSRYKNLMKAILRTVQQYPGNTSAEIAAILQVDRHATARRLPELARRGLVYRGAERVCRVTHSRCLTWWPGSNRKY